MGPSKDFWGLPRGSDGKASACNAGDQGSIPGLGRSPGEGNGNPLQYSCLENSMGGGAWWASWGHKELDTTGQFHFLSLSQGLLGLPRWHSSKEPINTGDVRDMGLIPASGRSPGEGNGLPTPVFLPGESHGQRSLEGTVQRVAKSQTPVKRISTHKGLLGAP